MQNLSEHQGCSEHSAQSPSHVKSLVELSSMALCDTLIAGGGWDWDLSSLPVHASMSIIERAYKNQAISLSFLLKFAQVPITSLELSSVGVTDAWMPILSSLPLRHLNLSQNPSVTDDGIAILAGLQSVSTSKDWTPRRQRSSSGAGPASGGSGRRRKSR